MRFLYRNIQRRFAPFVYLLVVGSIVILLLVACMSGGQTSRVSSPGRKPTGSVTSTSLLTPAVLTVGSYTDYLPQEFVDGATQQVTGFDIDLINAIAQHMHLKVVIVRSDFNSLIDNLINKDYDVVISAVSITPELQKKVDFIPYLQGGEALLVAAGNPLHIQKIRDLCGQSVVTKAKTFEEQDLNEASNRCRDKGQPPIKIIVMQQYNDMVQQLLSRQAVAAYLDASVVDYLVMQHAAQLQKAGATIDATMEGIAVRKGNTALLNAIKNAFAVSKADGTYQALIKKWGLSSGALS